MYPDIEELRSGAMLLIDKPKGWTSFDVIGRLRYVTHVKMGHAGTLDPLATGLLIICTSKYTKRINEYMGLPKTYTGSINIGSITESYDLETEPTSEKDISGITLADIVSAKSDFEGHIKQMPPMHSAIKKDGKRLYEYARKGKTIKVEPRDVYIERFDIKDYKDGKIKFEVVCGSGTYIRSLAHDLGKTLGVGGYLSELRRTAIGDYHVEDAYQIEDMIEHYRAQNIPRN